MPPSAGSGSGMAPNPVGYNRVYVHLDGEFSYEAWWKNFRAGRVFVTNGPLLRPNVEGQLPGAVLRGEPGKELEVGDRPDPLLRRPDQLPRHHPERQDQAFRPPGRVCQNKGRLPKLHFTQSGWFLVRAVSDLPDTYRVGDDRAVLRGDRLQAVA